MNKVIKITISVLMVTVLGLAAYVFELSSQVKEMTQEIQESRIEKVVFERTSQFDKQLEDLLDYKKNVASTFEKKSAWLSVDVQYENNGYETISLDGQTSFAYKVGKNGMEILIGNWDGSEYQTAHVCDLKNPEILVTELQADECVIESTAQRMLKFEWYGITFLMDENLNVWKEKEIG